LSLKVVALTSAARKPTLDGEGVSATRTLDESFSFRKV
jgi:hypothetical protein